MYCRSYLDTHRFQTLSMQSSHLHFGLPAFFFHVVPPEILFLWYYHQTLLPDDQPILVFLFLCCYNIWFTARVSYETFTGRK